MSADENKDPLGRDMTFPPTDIIRPLLFSGSSRPTSVPEDVEDDSTFEGTASELSLPSFEEAIVGDCRAGYSMSDMSTSYETTEAHNGYGRLNSPNSSHGSGSSSSRGKYSSRVSWGDANQSRRSSRSTSKSRRERRRAGYGDEEAGARSYVHPSILRKRSERDPPRLDGAWSERLSNMVATFTQKVDNFYGVNLSSYIPSLRQDRVSVKTVLMCMVGMFVVMKLNDPMNSAPEPPTRPVAGQQEQLVSQVEPQVNQQELVARQVQQQFLPQELVNSAGQLLDINGQLVNSADQLTQSQGSSQGSSQVANVATTAAEVAQLASQVINQAKVAASSPEAHDNANAKQAKVASSPPEVPANTNAAVTMMDNSASAVAPPGPVAGNELLGQLSNFADAWDPYASTDIPMFWHIPKAGGSSIRDAVASCHRFVQATEFGVTDGHIDDTEVAVVYPALPGGADTDRSPFVNIDSTTGEGIQRAKNLGFADAQLAQVVVSPFGFELNELFTQTAKGKLFTVFRHPIDRAVSMFDYIRVADWEPSYSPELKDWTLEQYAASDRVENNWMTRELSNQLSGELTEENLQNAMQVVRTKFLVGLMSQIERSMTRFEKVFQWKYHVNPPNQEACRERLMSGGSNSNAKNKKKVEEGSEAWTLLAQQNNFDLQLYEYIEQLFEEQEQFVTGVPDDFRSLDATCCKCDPPTFPPEGFTCPEAVKNVG